MGTRKIMDATNIETGEKIYFNSHALSTYMSNGKTVEDAIIKELEPSILNILDTKADKSDVEVEVEVEIENGVYAVTANGSLIDYNTADATATGVALVASEHKFMIAKADATDGTNTTLYWGKNLYGKDVAGVVTNGKVDGINDYGYLAGTSTPQLNKDFTTWNVGALSEFNGKANTAAIINGYTEHGVSMDARDMCTVLNTFNAADSYSDWYVPACGQLALMYLNMTEINAALSKIGGTALAAGYYWSSSVYSYDDAWGVGFNNGRVNYYSKGNPNRVRFVRDLTKTTIKKPLKEKVTELENNKADKIEIPTKMSQLLNDVFDLASTTNNGLMSTSDKTKLDSINNVYYGVCNTEPSSAYKVVLLANIQLKVGTIVNVYHYYTNTANLAYLVINNLAPYPIFYKLNQNISSALTVGGLKETVLSYVFTGSNFCYIGQLQTQSQSSNWWWATGIQTNGTTLIFNCTGFTKTNGMQITLPFTGFGWSALNMYLNINNTGACPVIYNGSATIPSGLLSRGTGGSYITVVYYNNNYYILSVTKDNLSQFNNDSGFVQSSTGDVKHIKKVTALPDNPDSNTLYIITS